jgi:hypothetical protein
VDDGQHNTGGASMMRRIDTCVVCGDPRVQIVSKGRCAKCLMKERREAERRGEPVHDPVEHTYLKELNSYLTRFVKAAAALEDAAIPETFISPEDHNTVRRIIRQAIDRIQAAKQTTEHHANGGVESVLLVPQNETGEEDERRQDERPQLTVMEPNPKEGES